MAQDFIELPSLPPRALTIDWSWHRDWSATILPSPAHVWCRGLFVQCVNCGQWKDHNPGPCDPALLAGKTEFCCECGEDYPRSELIAGHIYCAKCRLAELQRMKATSDKNDEVDCPRCGSTRVERFMRACIYPSDPMFCADCRHHFLAADIDHLWNWAGK